MIHSSEDKSLNFKFFKSRVEHYLGEYKKMNLLLANSNNEFIKSIFSNKYKKRKTEEFVRGVNIVLNAMNKENADILINVHINNKSFEELGYSRTSFYYKYKDAIQEFIQIVE